MPDTPRHDRLNRRRTLLGGAGLAASLSAALEARGAQAQAQAPARPAAAAYFWNVREFGAAGDGQRDDTQAIQAALDAAASSGGGLVVLPGGSYSTRTLAIRTGVHLAGAGIEATILKLRDGTNDDLLRTRDHARLVGSNRTLGPFNWSVRDLTLDGNRARNRAGCGLRVYGWGYVLRELRVRQCAGAGIDSEWSTDDPPWTEDGRGTPGDSMEAQFVNLKVHHCGQGGILVRGPHDSQLVNCVVYDTRTIGIDLSSGPNHSATGCQLVNCHVWGGHEYGYRIRAGYVNLANCVGEWASRAQVLIDEGDATLVGCRFFGDPKARHVGIEIGVEGRPPVYGSQIDARMADLHGGAFKFVDEGGSGQIRALVYQKRGVPYQGRPSSGTRFDLQVNGIDEGSTVWQPRGPLGWNGGTPIVRHLSGTAAWAPPALAAGAAASADVPVAGAEPGQTVAVGFSSPLPAGVLFSGVVSAPGVVTLTLFNATGQPLQPRPGTARADCWVH